MTLVEMQERAKAIVAERRGIVDQAVSEQRSLTDEEKTRVEAIDGERSSLMLAIDDRKAQDAEAREQDEARKAAGLDRVGDVRVIREPRTYEQHGENSFLNDLAVAQMPWMPGQSGAQQRLAAHNYETAVEVASGSEDGRKAERAIRVQDRSGNAKHTIAELRAMGGAGRENRALTSGSGSGGAFAPPVYLLDLYAPFRTAGRSFIDALNHQDLPSTGMTIDIPAITAAAGVSTQTENTAPTETDPTASLISASVVTKQGNITVSQQLLDRTGPWDGSYDKVMFDQLTRAYNTQVDQYALGAALAGAGSSTIAASGLNTGSLYTTIGQAEATIRSTAGVFRNPTAAFMSPQRWGWLSTQVDSENRPLVVPNATNGPMNAVASAAGNGNTGVEGFTSFNTLGLDIYQDANIPVPSVGSDQVIVLDPSAILVFEGNLVPRVLPQTKGDALSVILQVFAYIAVLPLYATAVQSISGAGFTTP